MYKLTSITTYYATRNEGDGVHNLDYGSIYKGYRPGIPNGSFTILQDYDGQLQCIGIQPHHAMTIVDHVAEDALAPNLAIAYGIYNGDIEGPDSGCLVDHIHDCTIAIPHAGL
jgi:hypothetical protein